MFTIKYRTYDRSRTQPVDGPTFYDENEQIHGPFDFVSREVDENNMTVVHAHRGAEPGMTFGPLKLPEVAGEKLPRPMLWVMNASGATVAKYDF